MNTAYHFLTRNRASRLLFGIYNEQLAYAFSRIPDAHQKQRKRFIIYGQGRTGSTLLVNILNSHPDIFCEREILMDKNLPWDGRAKNPYRMLQGKASLFRRKVYGFKVKIYQLTAQPEVGTPRTFLENTVEQNWKLVFLRRRNVFEHALSNIVAENINQYHFSKNGSTQKVRKLRLKIDPETLDLRMSERLRYAEEELQSIEGLPHVPIIYEDLAQDHQEGADAVFDHLGIESVPVKTRLKKSNTKRYSDLIENFNEVADFLRRKDWDHYLDMARV